MSAAAQWFLALACLVTLAGPAANAETIFRCGESYSQVACANGKAIEVDPPLSADRRAEARAVAAREKQLALEMVRDRRERESTVHPAIAGSLGAPPAVLAAPAPAKKHARAKKHGSAAEAGSDFIAVVPKTKG
ncbi:MAG TPA: hypothetical protein VGI48_17595 [Caldimonas sp.]|jgi:hypothetical protein